VAEFPTQLLARRFQFSTLPAHAARPRILAQGVDHRAPNPALGEGFKFDPARFIEAVGRVNQADDAILNQVSNID